MSTTFVVIVLNDSFSKPETAAPSVVVPEAVAALVAVIAKVSVPSPASTVPSTPNAAPVKVTVSSPAPVAEALVLAPKMIESEPEPLVKVAPTGNAVPKLLPPSATVIAVTAAMPLFAVNVAFAAPVRANFVAAVNVMSATVVAVLVATLTVVKSAACVPLIAPIEPPARFNSKVVALAVVSEVVRLIPNVPEAVVPPETVSVFKAVESIVDAP